MRLDGAVGDRATVWDCEAKVRVKDVMWVDDATHQYALMPEGYWPITMQEGR